MTGKRRSIEIRRQKLIERKVYRQRRTHKRRLLSWKSEAFSRIQPSLNVWKDTRSVSLLYKILPITNAIYQSEIKIPRKFSFQDSHDECVTVFAAIVSLLHNHVKEVHLDFSECEDVSVSAISLLYILLRDYNSSVSSVAKKKSKTKFNIVPPDEKNCRRVLKYLKIFDIYDSRDFTEKDGEFLKLSVLSGKFRNSFMENRKATASKKIVEFINQSCIPAGKMLSKNGRNLFESLTNEMLNNAEDHSFKKEMWYVSGVTFHDSNKDADLLELNLTILNFGDSFFEGFEKTKTENMENYQKLEKLHNLHKAQFSRKRRFEKESLFTLYMLNEGISRLKYEDESRGNGTMQYLKAFADLEDKGPQDNKYKSTLKIITGHTTLICESDVAPFGGNNGHLRISLNKEQDIKLLPEMQYLQHHRQYFPGTFVECRVFLNRNLIVQKNG